MNNFGSAFFAGFALLLTVAVVAVIVSQNAQTAAIIQATGGSVAQDIGAAVAPVTQTGQVL